MELLMAVEMGDGAVMALWWHNWHARSSKFVGLHRVGRSEEIMSGSWELLVYYITNCASKKQWCCGHWASRCVECWPFIFLFLSSWKDYMNWVNATINLYGAVSISVIFSLILFIYYNTVVLLSSSVVHSLVDVELWLNVRAPAKTICRTNVAPSSCWLLPLEVGTTGPQQITDEFRGMATDVRSHLVRVIRMWMGMAIGWF
jgi:hypothetical protein